MIVHPEVGKWLIALGEKAFGMDPFGWRVAAAVVGSLMVLVMCRLARRLTGSTMLGLRGRGAADARRPALRAVAPRAARHLRGVLPAVRRRLPWSTTATTTAPGSPAGSRSGGRRRGRRAGDRCACCCCGRGCSSAGVCFGLAVRHQVDGALPAGGLRPAGVGLERGRPPFLRGALVGAEGGRSSTAPRRSSSSCWWRPSSTRRRGPVGSCTRTSTRSTLSSTQYTQFVQENGCRGTGEDRTTDNETDPSRKWPTATEPDADGLGEVTQSLRSLWYYHRDVYTFHTHYLNCSDHQYASQPSGWLARQPAGRGGHRPRHRARRAGLRGRARARSATARCC